MSLKNLFGDELMEYQLLETDKNGAGTYFLKSRQQENPDAFDSILGFGGYLTEPFSIRDGKATMTFLGSSIQIRRILKAIDAFKIPHKYPGFERRQVLPRLPIEWLDGKTAKDYRFCV